MRSAVWLVVAIACLLPSASSAAPRSLALSLGVEGIEAERAEPIARVIDEAVAELPGWILGERDHGCSAATEACLLAAARAADVDRVLHTTLRPIGEGLSLVLVLVGREPPTRDRYVESIPSGHPEAARAILFRLLAPERHVGSLAVEAARGSEIWLDGNSHGVAPLAGPIPDLRPGSYVLRVVRPGGAEARSYVEIKFGALTRVRVEPRSDEVSLIGYAASSPADGVASAGNPAAMASPAPADGAASGGSHDALDLLGSEETAEGPASAHTAADSGGGLAGWSVAKWSLAGGGALALTAGAITATYASSSRDAREALRGRGSSFRAEDLGRQAALADEYRSRRTASTVLVVGGGAMLVGAGLLFFWDDLFGSAEGASSSSTAVTAGFGVDGIVLSRSF